MTAASDNSSLPPHVRAAAEAVTEHQAIGPCLLDLRGRSDFADYFLVVSGSSDRHVRALSDAVAESLLGHSRALHVEGLEQAKWVLMDHGDLLVHIFDEEARRFYRLERLWRDAPRIALEDRAATG